MHRSLRTLAAEFKAFATAGTVIDLALGVVIGAAFSRVVESLAGNVIVDAIAALGGSTSTDDLVVHLNGGAIHYGRFLSAVISFTIVVLALFLLLKTLGRFGVLNVRTAGQHECPWCLDFVPVGARRCRHCGSDLADEPTAA